jgi:hypothetical protein
MMKPIRGRITGSLPGARAEINPALLTFGVSCAYCDASNFFRMILQFCYAFCRNFG